MSVSHRFCAAAFVVATLVMTPALAAAPKTAASSLLPGANSKEPISIDADKLNYFDKEQKAIYTGNVVATQGDSQLKCSVMTIFLAKSEPAGASANGAATPAAPASADAGPTTSGTQVKHMDATGPVTITSKTQVAT